MDVQRPLRAAKVAAGAVFGGALGDFSLLLVDQMLYNLVRALAHLRAVHRQSRSTVVGNMLGCRDMCVNASRDRLHIDPVGNIVRAPALAQVTACG